MLYMLRIVKVKKIFKKHVLTKKIDDIIYKMSVKCRMHRLAEIIDLKA